MNGHLNLVADQQLNYSETRLTRRRITRTLA